MKSLITALALAVSFPLAMAQQRVPMPVVCAEPAMVEKVLKEHKEEVLFAGRDTMQNIENLSVNLFHNPNTGTYSIVLVAPDSSIVCVIASGIHGKLIYKN